MGPSSSGYDSGLLNRRGNASWVRVPLDPPMIRENFVLKTLLEKGEVVWKPHGNSMVPKINSGDQVVVKKVSAQAVRVGDAVYAKVKGSYYLHLLSAIDQSKGRYQISNNHGHVNGWVTADNIFGVCVQVKDKIILFIFLPKLIIIF